tara:strand:+ start:423 stop:644 length:222 start_codon:yes stop_codon:yes gene_type:complete
MQLRFTDYDCRDDGSLEVIGIKAGRTYSFVQSEVMPMYDAGVSDPDGFWSVWSERFGLITFQSIDIEEKRERA